MRVLTHFAGWDNLGQTLVRPLSISCGRSYDKNNRAYEPSLSAKVTLVALAILLAPLSLPLIGLGLILVACSKEHKKRFQALSLPMPPQERLLSPSKRVKEAMIALSSSEITKLQNEVIRPVLEKLIIVLGEKYASDAGVQEFLQGLCTSYARPRILLKWEQYFTSQAEELEKTEAKSYSSILRNLNLLMNESRYEEMKDQAPLIRSFSQRALDGEYLFQEIREKLKGILISLKEKEASWDDPCIPRMMNRLDELISALEKKTKAHDIRVKLVALNLSFKKAHPDCLDRDNPVCQCYTLLF